MTLNELAISTFESDYLKNYLASINHKFTAEQIVTIIINSNLKLNFKIRALCRLLNQAELFEYESENIDRLLEEIELIKNDYVYIRSCCYGEYDSILTFNDEFGNTQCFTSLSALRNLMLSNQYNNKSINIVDGIDSSDVAYIEVDKDCELVSYSLCKPVNGRISKLYNAYIDIPNNIEIGDVVRVHGSNTEYIVISDSKIPDELKDKSEYSVDVCVTVVPKAVLDSSKDYKKQIEDIKEHRIKNVDNEEDELDILSVEHEHIHLTMTEKQ